MLRHKLSPIAVDAVAEALIPGYADADQETTERALDAAVRLLSFARNMAALNHEAAS